MQWWKENPNLYEKFLGEIKEFPFLNVSIEDDFVIIRGQWPVYGKETLITEYSIKIEIPESYPKEVPKVYELEEEIPREPDHHMNEDGTACLFSPPERWEKWPLGSGINTLLSGPIKEYFFSQAYHKRTNKWPFGEWAHGDAGVIEYYFDRLKMRSLNSLKGFIKLSPYNHPTRQWKCPCGSKKRYIKCHWVLMEPLVKSLPRKEWIYIDNLLKNISK